MGQTTFYIPTKFLYVTIYNFCTVYLIILFLYYKIYTAPDECTLFIKDIVDAMLGTQITKITMSDLPTPSESSTYVHTIDLIVQAIIDQVNIAY